MTGENKQKTMDFSELIKMHRKSKRMTQKDFGELIGKKQVTISNYEKGVHYPNDVEEIKLIASVINQPVSVVVDSIQYAKRGVIEQHEALLIDLDKMTDNELQQQYKFVVDGKEITGEELEKMLELLKFERFRQGKA